MKTLAVIALFIAQYGVAAITTTAQPVYVPLVPIFITTPSPAAANTPLADMSTPVAQLRGEQLNQRIEQGLRTVMWYDPARVHVTSDGDEVTVEGSVDTQTQADEIMAAARKADNGKDVIDDLDVQNVSQ